MGEEEQWPLSSLFEIQRNGPVLGGWREFDMAGLKFEKVILPGILIPSSGGGEKFEDGVMELV